MAPKSTYKKSQFQAYAREAEKILNKELKKLCRDAGLEARVQYLGQEERHIEDPNAWIVGDGQWHSQTRISFSIIVGDVTDIVSIDR